MSKESAILEIKELFQEESALKKRSIEIQERIGILLLAVKEEIGEGKFHQWVRDNCPFDPERASVYIRFAKRTEIVGGLQVVKEAGYSMTSLTEYMPESEFKEVLAEQQATGVLPPPAQKDPKKRKTAVWVPERKRSMVINAMAVDWALLDDYEHIEADRTHDDMWRIKLEGANYTKTGVGDTFLKAVLVALAAPRATALLEDASGGVVEVLSPVGEVSHQK